MRGCLDELDVNAFPSWCNRTFVGEVLHGRQARSMAGALSAARSDLSPNLHNCVLQLTSPDAGPWQGTIGRFYRYANTRMTGLRVINWPCTVHAVPIVGSSFVHREPVCRDLSRGPCKEIRWKKISEKLQIDPRLSFAITCRFYCVCLSYVSRCLNDAVQTWPRAMRFQRFNLGTDGSKWKGWLGSAEIKEGKQ